MAKKKQIGEASGEAIWRSKKCPFPCEKAGISKGLYSSNALQHLR
jgi:hypothetical protein